LTISGACGPKEDNNDMIVALVRLFCNFYGHLHIADLLALLIE
jgi:hypothetical protein